MDPESRQLGANALRSEYDWQYSVYICCMQAKVSSPSMCLCWFTNGMRGTLLPLHTCAGPRAAASRSAAGGSAAGCGGPGERRGVGPGGRRGGGGAVAQRRGAVLPGQGGGSGCAGARCQGPEYARWFASTVRLGTEQEAFWGAAAPQAVPSPMLLLPSPPPRTHKCKQLTVIPFVVPCALNAHRSDPPALAPARTPSHPCPAYCSRSCRPERPHLGAGQCPVPRQRQPSPSSHARGVGPCTHWRRRGEPRQGQPGG